MDLRVKKTKNSIINAFLTLRAHKPLEKITIKELAELAMINKATFYLHYKDIYDLSDSLETEVVNRIVTNVANPESLFTDVTAFTKELVHAFFAERTMIDTIFSGSQMNRLPQKFEETIRRLAYEQCPERMEELPYNLFLSYAIYGGYHAYRQNVDSDLHLAANLIGAMSQASKDACDAIVAEQQS